MSEAFPLPTAYTRQMEALLGSESEAYFASLNEAWVRGLRLNPRKPLADPFALIPGLGDAIPWQSPNGFYLPPDSDAGADALHEAGAYYLQEPSAMVPVNVLAPLPGETVLDLCAAPGGKSTQIADVMQGQGLLVCNEPVLSRARVLSRNVERMGVTNALVVSAEPERLEAIWGPGFDAVLVDAPCSGEAMFRRHPETRSQWSEQTPAGCAVRQKRILAAACGLLKKGGRLVYSTCAFNREENDQVVRWLMESKPDMEPLSFSVRLGERETLNVRDGSLHLYPHQMRGEGHFVALFRKRGEEDAPRLLRPAAERLSPPNLALAAAYSAFCEDLGGTGLPRANAQFGNELLSAPDLPELKGVQVLRAGLRLGEMKGKVFAPDHALAMALFNPGGLKSFALDQAQARAYQRGEEISLPESNSGFLAATYHGLTLGFGKASAGRLKNHYPKGLRRP